MGIGWYWEGVYKWIREDWLGNGSVGKELFGYEDGCRRYGESVQRNKHFPRGVCWAKESFIRRQMPMTSSRAQRQLIHTKVSCLMTSSRCLPRYSP